MPSPLTVVWDERFRSYDFGPDHPFQESYRALGVRLLDAVPPPDPPGRILQVELASREVLERFHAPEYLDYVAERDRSGRRRPLDAGDTPAFPGCFEASARLVGGTLAARDAIAGGGPVASFAPGGGLHHAQVDRASGFCIFNDLAVTIATELAARGPAARIAYVDIDAHHGDGVMYGFYDDGRLLDIDVHQDGRTIFPGTGSTEEIGRGDGAGRKVNLPLLPGHGDREFRHVFDRVALPLLEEFAPEWILLQCGVDGHEGDALGATALRFTGSTYAHVVRSLLSLRRGDARIPLLVTGGGGYSPEHVARTLAAVGRQLAGATTPREATLPVAWRTEFERTTGRPAPTGWEVARVTEHPDGERATEDVVARLERALGRRFPKAEPPRGGRD